MKAVMFAGSSGALTGLGGSARAQLWLIKAGWVEGNCHPKGPRDCGWMCQPPCKLRMCKSYLPCQEKDYTDGTWREFWIKAHQDTVQHLGSATFTWFIWCQLRAWIWKDLCVWGCWDCKVSRKDSSRIGLTGALLSQHSQVLAFCLTSCFASVSLVSPGSGEGAAEGLTQSSFLPLWVLALLLKVLAVPIDTACCGHSCRSFAAEQFSSVAWLHLASDIQKILCKIDKICVNEKYEIPSSSVVTFLTQQSMRLFASKASFAAQGAVTWQRICKKEGWPSCTYLIALAVGRDVFLFLKLPVWYSMGLLVFFSPALQ